MSLPRILSTLHCSIRQNPSLEPFNARIRNVAPKRGRLGVETETAEGAGEATENVTESPKVTKPARTYQRKAAAAPPSPPSPEHVKIDVPPTPTLSHMIGPISPSQKSQISLSPRAKRKILFKRKSESKGVQADVHPDRQLTALKLENIALKRQLKSAAGFDPSLLE